MKTDNEGPVGPAAFAKRHSRGGRNHRPDQARVDAETKQPRQAPVEHDPPDDRRPEQAPQPREERDDGLLGRARGLFERDKGIGHDPVQQMRLDNHAESDANQEGRAKEPADTRPPARDGVIDLEEQFERSEAGDDSQPREVELMQVGPSVSDNPELQLNMSSELNNADVLINEVPSRGGAVDSEVEFERGDTDEAHDVEMMQIGPSVSDDPDLRLDMSELDDTDVSTDEVRANAVEFDDAYTRSEDDGDSATSESALRDRLDEIDAERRITRRALSNLRAGRPSPAQSRRPARQQKMPFLRGFERRWEKRRR